MNQLLKMNTQFRRYDRWDKVYHDLRTSKKALSVVHLETFGMGSVMIVNTKVNKEHSCQLRTGK